MLLLAGGVGLGGLAPLYAANAWVRREAAPFLHERAGTVPRRSVAIVPGARVHADGRPFPVLEDRLEAARALYVAGKVERILVSGAGGSSDHDETAGMATWLVAHGVPAAHVIEDPGGVRTLATMDRAAAVYGVRDAVVCTQRFHLSRAVFLARRSGIDAVGLVADRRIYRNRRRHDAREVLARARAVVDVL